jgi:hypothetical protein
MQAQYKEIKEKIVKAVDSIKVLALEQDWDINTFNVVMRLMNDAVQRKIYNTKFVDVLEGIKPDDPLVEGHTAQEAQKKHESELADK